MAENATTPALDGKESVYDAFKTPAIVMALDTELMLEEMIGNKGKRMYNSSEIVEVTKKARMDNESG
eukprot:9604630-Ditylum_brightwellii.AAC.1